MTEKLKSFLLDDKLFYGFLVLQMSLISFILGMQMGRAQPVPQAPRPALPLEAAAQAQSLPVAPAANTIESGDFVASRSGSRYHKLSCPGAKQIKEENKVFFASAQAAEAAGYKRAANCP